MHAAHSTATRAAFHALDFISFPLLIFFEPKTACYDARAECNRAQEDVAMRFQKKMVCGLALVLLPLAAHAG